MLRIFVDFFNDFFIKFSSIKAIKIINLFINLFNNFFIKALKIIEKGFLITFYFQYLFYSNLLQYKVI